MESSLHQQAGDNAIQINRARDVTIQTIYQPPAPGIPFQAPPLPAYFIPRPEFSEPIKAQLLSEGPNMAGVLVVSAIQGLGGIGKSVLATSLAHEKALQEHFADGVLWATLGQQPEVLSLLSGWIQALGDYNFHPTHIDAATAHLRGLLHDKACLLVVDDAWQAGHALPFLAGGQHCRVLVTTRDSLIARTVGARLYSMDVMSSDQALALLSGKLAYDFDADEKAFALRLADAVGYLPLALELIAAQLADGVPWQELLHDLEAEVARLEALDIPGADEVTDEALHKRLSLVASLNLSLQRLTPERKTAFAWFGVLPEDVLLNAKMAATLWDIQERDARDLLRYLRDKALLLLGPSAPDNLPTYRVHDLLHDLACKRLPMAPPDGANLAIPVAQARLIERYRSRTTDGLWRSLPDDGYIHAHLTWHMEIAGQIAAIHALLREETPAGKNGWYEACERLGQAAIFIADVRRARELAGKLPEIGWDIRYGLMTASMNSLAGNVPPALLARLVSEKLWTTPQALAYATQAPDVQQRFDAFTALAACVSEAERPVCLAQALMAARQIDDAVVRAPMLGLLAAQLGGHPDLLAQILDRIQKEDEHVIAAVLMAMAPHVIDQPKLLEQAREIVSRFHDPYHHTEVSTALEPQPGEPSNFSLQTPHIVGQAADPGTSNVEAATPNLSAELQIALEMGDERSRAYAFSALASQLGQHPDLLTQAVEAARKIEDAYARSGALMALALHLSPAERQLTFEQAVDAARQIGNEYARIETFGTLASLVSGQADLLVQLLNAARQIGDQDHSAKALCNLVGLLGITERQGSLSKVLDSARQIGDEHPRSEVLIRLISWLDGQPDLLAQALAAVTQISAEGPRTEALIVLIPHLRGWPDLLAQALDAVRQISQKRLYASVLKHLVAHLHGQPGLLEQTLEAADGIDEDYLRIEVLLALFPQLKGQPNLLVRAFDVVCQMRNGHARIELLNGLASQLSGQSRRSVLAERMAILSQTLHVTGQAKDEFVLADTLVSLAPQLSRQRNLLAQALRAARAMTWDSNRAAVLSALAPQLSHYPHLITRALRIATQKIANRDDRATVFCAFAFCLNDQNHQAIVVQALDTVYAIKSPLQQANLLIALIPQLSEYPDLFAKALDAAIHSEGIYHHVEILNALVPYLKGRPDLLKQVQEHTERIYDVFYQVRVLTVLVPLLDITEGRAILAQAVNSLRGADYARHRSAVLGALAPLLSGHSDLLEQAIDHARRLSERDLFSSDDRPRAAALSALALQLHDYPALLSQMLDAVRQIDHDRGRSEVLCALITQLDGYRDLLAQASELANQLNDERYRSQALSALAGRIANVPPLAQRLWWRSAFPVLISRTRRDLLGDLAALAPVIHALGGEAAIAETFRAIQDVSRWWP